MADNLTDVVQQMLFDEMKKRINKVWSDFEQGLIYGVNPETGEPNPSDRPLTDYVGLDEIINKSNGGN